MLAASDLFTLNKNLVIRYCTPKVRAKNLTFGVFYMIKYNEEFKLKLVTEYLEGNISYGRLALKYNVSSPTSIKNWVQNYKAYGKKGLEIKKRREEYPVHFKLYVLHFMKQSGASYQETAIKFNLNSPSLVGSWNRKFSKEGIEGLQDMTKEPSSMPKKTEKTTKKRNQTSTMTREELLERENELLRLEIAYLKKLKAFRENPDAFLEKIKQHWHSNSKKKDFN